MTSNGTNSSAKAPKKVTPIRKGLSNVGNTCFANSILQSLLNLVEFSKYLTSLEKRDGGGLATKLKDLRKQLRDGNDSTSYVDSQSFVRELKKIPDLGGFLNLKQQDAHEFQQSLLNYLDSSCKSKKIELPTLKKSLFKGPVIKISNQLPSLTKSPFEGKMISTLMCRHCQYKNSTCFPFTDITLSPSGLAQNSVINYLQTHTEEELINDWKCDKCNRFGASKRLQILQQPKILCLHLRRAVIDSRGYSHKVMTHVSFPRNLTLDPYCASFDPYLPEKRPTPPRQPLPFRGHDLQPGGNESYELPPTKKSVIARVEPTQEGPYAISSVVVHLGADDRGHYMAYLAGKTKAWSISDNEVKKVSMSELLNARAMLLFYERNDK